MVSSPRGKLCKRCGQDDWYGPDSRSRCAVCKRKSARVWHDENQTRAMWLRARSRSRRKGLPFSLTEADILGVWPQDGRCPVLGIPLERTEGSGVGSTSPSLDRIRPALGYVPGNVMVISGRANKIKSDAETADEVLAVGAWMKRLDPQRDS